MDIVALFPGSSPRPPRRLGSMEVEEIVERMFAAPFVDPGQVPLHHVARVDTGERRLALAILDDAIRCAIRHGASPLRHQREEAREALRWIESDETDYALSFVPICQTFSIDPDWIRGLVRRALAIQPASRAMGRSRDLARVDDHDGEGVSTPTRKVA